MSTEFAIISENGSSFQLVIDVRDLEPEIKRLLDIVRDGWVDDSSLNNLLTWSIFCHVRENKNSYFFKACSKLELHVTEHDFSVFDSKWVEKGNQVMTERLKEEEFYVERLTESGLEISDRDQRKIEKYRELCGQEFSKSDFSNLPISAS